MRKLVYGINLTVDGCCDHTKGISDTEVHDYFTRVLRQADVLVYGRKTYELMVPFWPDLAKNHSGKDQAAIDFAQAFQAVPKIVVFSQSLEIVSGSKTEIFRGGLKEEILKLKQLPGKNILTGGVALPLQLVELGLVDEFNIVVHPVVAGKGRRLFDGLDIKEQQKLKLVETKTFKSGVIALRYLK